jgi:serine/threonine-protein kinase HipA
LFALLKKYVPAYSEEAPKLFKIILFNYLLSNGDAHFKNLSLIETSLGDFRLSPAYDLLNSRIHINNRDFALEDGLLPKKDAKGKIREQFYLLGTLAEIPLKQLDKIMGLLTSKEAEVK